MEATFLLVVARPNICLLIHDFLAKPGRIRAKRHSRVILDREGGKQGIVDCLGLLAHYIPNRVCLVVILYALQTWILLRLLSNLLICAITLGL